jgi:tetratricopeptide (TPR) repeat protein
MVDGRRLRTVLVGAAIVLVGAIYFLPKLDSPKDSEQPASPQGQNASKEFSEQDYVKSSRAKLSWENGAVVDSLEKLLGSSTVDTTVFDSLAAIWDGAGVPGMAARCFQQKAQKVGGEKNWVNAAFRFFDAFKAASDSTESSWFVSKAIESYDQVLKINPSNLNAKTDLGILYAEATDQPMRGITLLREVVTENPLHENAQMNLGFLSMKSGQYDKAIERFNMVLQINRSRIDAHVYLGEAYLQKGNPDSAIVNFEIFKNLSNDQDLINQIDQYIAEIKKGKK